MPGSACGGGMTDFPKEKRYWPDRRYASLLQAMTTETFTFAEDRIDLINRAASTSGVPYVPRRWAIPRPPVPDVASRTATRQSCWKPVSSTSSPSRPEMPVRAVLAR